MQVLLNDKSEIISYAIIGDIKGINCIIPDDVLNDNPLSYKYTKGKFIKNADYGKPTLEQAIKGKTTEINTACENAIVGGVDYNGGHYSLTSYDQTNIMALGELAKGGKDVPYHANGEICRFYTPAEMLGLVSAVIGHTTYNTTYANLLKHQVAEMTVVDDAQAVVYGVTKLNEIYQAKFDEIMGALSNAAT